MEEVVIVPERVVFGQALALQFPEFEAVMVAASKTGEYADSNMKNRRENQPGKDVFIGLVSGMEFNSKEEKIESG
jgi:hypothetical protein